MTKPPSIIGRLSPRGRWILRWARFEGFCHRWLGFSTRLFISTLFALGFAAASAQEPAAAPQDFSVPGVRVTGRDGKVVEGVLQPGAPAGVLWIKNVDGTVAVPVDSIASREDASLELRRVYGPDEVLGFLMGRLRPSSAEEFDRLGAELLRAKLEERALSAFRMAETLRRPEGLEARMQAELFRLRDRIDDLALRRTVFEAQESCLGGDYDAALAQIDEVERAMGDRSTGLFTEIRRLRAQVEEGRGRSRDAQVVEEWWRTVEALLKSRAMDRALPFAKARAFVEKDLPGEVLARVRRRFNFSPDDRSASLAWEQRPAEPVLKHSYGEASWFAIRPDARLPEEWWAGATDGARYALLKGITIEKHFGTVRADAKSCGRCGGEGLVDGRSCDACSGLKAERVVFYR